MEKIDKIELFYEKAYEIVKEIFDGVTDKGGKPYLEHCLFVSRESLLGVYEYADKYSYDIRNVSMLAQIIGLLHDVIEDSKDWDEEKLKDIFGEFVSDRVKILTRDIPSYDDYIQRIIDSGDIITLVVKRSDLIHNMDVTRLKVLTDKDLSRIKKYHKAYMQIDEKISML